MRYVSFLLVHIYGNSAKPNTSTTWSKLLLYSIYLTITFTRQTGNNRDTKHTIWLSASPTVKQTTKKIRTVNTGRDSKQVYVWLCVTLTFIHTYSKTVSISNQTTLSGFIAVPFFNSTGMSQFHFRLKWGKTHKDKKKKSTMLPESPPPPLQNPLNYSQ